MADLIQPSLTGGELSPSLWARADLERFYNSLKTCRNFIVSPYGGVKNRPGFRFIGEVKDSSKFTRVLRFAFNSEQNYVVEMGAGYFRFYNGGSPVKITGSFPSWITATFYTKNTIITHTAVLYLCQVNHVSGTFATDLSNGLWVAIPADGTSEAANDYTESELPSVRCDTQSADVMTFTHPNHQPMQLKRISEFVWNFEPQNLDLGPFQPINTDKNISVWSDKSVGDITFTATADLFTEAHVGMLFYMEQRDFGQAWTPGASMTVGTIRRAGNNYYEALTASTTGQNIPVGTNDHWNDGGVDWRYLHNGWGVARIYDILTAKTAKAFAITYIPNGATTAGYGASKAVGTNGIWGPGYISGVSTAHGLTVGSIGRCLISGTIAGSAPFTDVEVDYSVYDANTIIFYLLNGIFGIVTITSFKPPLSITTAGSTKWAFGAFGEDPGYPAVSGYFQQRLAFASTAKQPTTLWFSRSGAFDDFSTTSPLQDDDAVSYHIAQRQMDEIRGIVPSEKLIVLTSGSAWIAGTGYNSDVLTPSNISLKMQSYRGTSNIPALCVGEHVIYVEDKGRVVRDLTYQALSERVAGSDLTAFASHLVAKSPITEWAWQSSPHQCVWAVREDGVILGLTYMPEHQIYGWHRHDTDGIFESVCVTSEGEEDILYAVIKRTINGQTKRYIERMATRNFTNVKDCAFLDSYLPFDGRNTNAGITITLSGGTTWDETDSFTATATGGTVFIGASDVGDQIVYEDEVNGITYRLEVIATPIAQTATVRPNRLIPSAYRSARSDWAWARDKVTGLGHLEGKTVAVYADGAILDSEVVTSGQISISPSVRGCVGLPITADLETLNLSIPGSETILTKNKTIPVVNFFVEEASSVVAGPDFDHLDECPIRTTENYDVPTTPKTGLAEVGIASGWGTTGQVVLRNTRPVPVSILAIIPDIRVGGK